MQTKTYTTEREAKKAAARAFRPAIVRLPNLYGRGGAEALNTDDGDSRDKIVGGKGYDYRYIDPDGAVSGCNVP